MDIVHPAQYITHYHHITCGRIRRIHPSHCRLSNVHCKQVFSIYRCSLSHVSLNLFLIINRLARINPKRQGRFMLVKLAILLIYVRFFLHICLAVFLLSKHYKLTVFLSIYSVNFICIHVLNLFKFQLTFFDFKTNH